MTKNALNRPLVYPGPVRELWRPRIHRLRSAAVGVRFKTEICDIDSQGNVVSSRVGNSGWNMVTDWGMDALATLRQDQLVNYLHISDTLGPSKRVLTGGITLTLTITDATNIDVAASAGFFDSGDVGNTLYIDDLGQELKIVAFTDSQHVKCATRPGAWLPGVTPSTGPFSTAGVHFTSVNTLANQTTKFNTYDTSASDNKAELNDSSNSRFIHQRIFLSGTVTGSAWTVRQLGWSDGNGSNNVFGWVNLPVTDTVPVGKKYRVTLQVYSAYTPLDIESHSVDWGETIGSYDLRIKQERLGYDSKGTEFLGGQSQTVNNFLQPLFPGTASNTGFRVGFLTTAQTEQPLLWAGDAGFTINIHNRDDAGANAAATVADSGYTSGTHTKTRTLTWPDTMAISAATMLGLGTQSSFGGGAFYSYALSIFPLSGTITKPAGWSASLAFPIYWTRTLIN